MPKYGIILAIMDMASAKSDVNGRKKKYILDVFQYKSDKTPTKKRLKKV